VQLSAVKRADDGSGDLIVRFHEACGDRVAVTVRPVLRPGAAWRCNALEERGAAIELADDVAAIVLRPFELVTLRFAAR
jgi:alpha-mannosidase